MLSCRWTRGGWSRGGCTSMFVSFIYFAACLATAPQVYAQQTVRTAPPPEVGGGLAGTSQAASGSTQIANPPAAQSQVTQAAPTAARISLLNGQLTVAAQNSDLSQILAEIARVTGMSITGLNGGKRVFGIYGPGEPRAILTGLLMGSGYNFLLVGGDAAPRQLVLMPESKAPPRVAVAPKPEPVDENEDQYAEQDSTDPYR
jgi:hypothetical protein